MSAFEFAETMTGSFHLLDAPERDRPMSFSIRARSPGMLRFFQNPEVEIEGEADLEGFADHRRLRGTLGLDILRKRKLCYAFAFEDNEGKLCHFVGEKNLRAGALVTSMTVLPGSLLRSAGDEIGRAILRFDLRNDLVEFVKSFRPAR